MVTLTICPDAEEGSIGVYVSTPRMKAPKELTRVCVVDHAEEEAQGLAAHYRELLSMVGSPCVVVVEEIGSKELMSMVELMHAVLVGVELMHAALVGKDFEGLLDAIAGADADERPNPFLK